MSRHLWLRKALNSQLRISETENFKKRGEKAKEISAKVDFSKFQGFHLRLFQQTVNNNDFTSLGLFKFFIILLYYFFCTDIYIDHVYRAIFPFP